MLFFYYIKVFKVMKLFSLVFVSVISITLLNACGSEKSVPKKPAAILTNVSQTDPLMQLVQSSGVNQRKETVAVDVEQPFFNRSVANVEQTGYLNNQNVQDFIQYYAQRGLDHTMLHRFFEHVGYRKNLINLMNKPATSSPWYVFRKGNANIVKINRGRQFYANNRFVIDRIAQQYGIPAQIMVAILGIETEYGVNKGNIRVADSLATLAFDYPRRGAFFQQELAQFLYMAEEEKRDPFTFTGSFAGAMGLPQFMPSSFRKWAVDADGNGQRDIWNNVGDAVASVANYMKVHGWQKNGKMIVPVTLNLNSQLQTILDEKTSLHYTVGQLRQMGVVPLQAVSDNEKAILFSLESSPNHYDYFIGLNNFYTVWQYNHSRMYVTAVRDIANSMGADL